MCEKNCDTCEANEITIKILTNRLIWIEELLGDMTDYTALHYFNICNDIKKAQDHNMSAHVINRLIEEKEKFKKAIREKKHVIRHI
jgi:hypothetical protein